MFPENRMIEVKRSTKLYDYKNTRSPLIFSILLSSGFSVAVHRLPIPHTEGFLLTGVSFGTSANQATISMENNLFHMVCTLDFSDPISSLT
jgi:hypothetical protein